MDELDKLLRDLETGGGASGADESAKQTPRTSNAPASTAAVANKPPQSPTPTSASLRAAGSSTPARSTGASPVPARAHDVLEQLVKSTETGQPSQKQLQQQQQQQQQPLSVATSGTGPVCAACNNHVDPSEPVILAIGNTYHKEHFKCGKCSKMLAGGVFFERDGQPWCDKCVNDGVLLPKCAYCGENIKGKCINALDKHWHPDHFFCSQCGRHFPAGGGFMERDGKAYCDEDYYNMFAPKCGSCDKPIMTEVITALGKSFHSECFLCAESGCKVQLANAGSFFEHGGKAYCELHYHGQRGSLCASCQKPIVGRCLTAIGKKFHPEHFVCAYCKKQLSSAGATNNGAATFRDHDGKPYCIGCFSKLYC